MIQEDYVSFETAKLLKEKGFDAECKKYYNLKMLTNLYYGCEYVRNRDLKDEDDCIAPSLGMAMKWLREVHKIEIRVIYDNEELSWYGACNPMNEPSQILLGSGRKSKSYEEACESAIGYCLKNLI